VQRLVGGLSPESAAKFWAGGAAGHGAPAASAPADITAAAAAAAASGAVPGSWTFTPPPGGSSLVASSPHSLGGPLAHFGVAPPAVPPVRRSLDSPLAAGADPFLDPRPLRITYGDVQTRLRTDETLFNITGQDDWTCDDRKRYRNASAVLVNSVPAITQGWVAKPPYSLLVNPLAPAPPGSIQVAESDRLGRNLARAAVWRHSSALINDSYGDEARRLAQVLETWHEYCTVSIQEPLAASSRLPDLKQVVMAHFAEREEMLRHRLRDANLGELIPFVEAQSAILPKLFSTMDNRVREFRKRSKGEMAKASVSNTEWMLFYHPFFQELFRVDGAELAPDRAAAALQLTAAALAHGGGAPAAPPPAPPAPPPPFAPPPPYVPLQAPYPYPAYGAYQPPAWAPPPPPHALPPHPAAVRALAPPAAAAAAAAAAPGGGGAPRRLPLHLPCSADIIGPQLAVWHSPPSSSLCRVCAAAGRSQAHFECPARYASVLGAPCPGFDAAGARVPGDWAGQDLQRAARVAWTAYAARYHLSPHRTAPGAPPPRF
jgi:hypothetical protein